MPYSFDNNKNDTYLQREKSHFQIYKEITEEAPFNQLAKIGNAAKVIDYVANGECTDWMLAS